MPLRRHASRDTLATFLLCVALVASAASRPAAAGTLDAAGTGGIRLAGLLPLDGKRIGRWCLSGVWFYPVGDPRDAGRDGPDGDPGYRVNRGLEPRASGVAPHEGADLSNRQEGGTVRAAAHGLVVCAATSEKNGYGAYVVLAHRLEDGSLAYSVYAHLAAGSIQVHDGEFVPGGRTLGRVGHTGRASTDHLHFEVRLARDPEARWETARPVDPLAFVAAHMPADLADTSWARPYIEWAEYAALIPLDSPSEVPLERTTWWHMLARAAWDPLQQLPSEPESLRRELIVAGLLPDAQARDSGGSMDWREFARDLSRLRQVGLDLPACGVGGSEHRALCESRFGQPRPARHLRRLTRLRGHPLTIADACLALADLSAETGSNQPRTRAQKTGR
jgi:murein DD-endopeptidase MepM/ murein hydrolase activator NlpD